MDVADAGGDDVGRVDRVDGNLVARHLKRQGRFHAATHHAKHHLGVFRSAEQAHDAVAVHLHAGDGAAVDTHDAVASHDASPFAGAFGRWLDDNERVVEHIKLHTDALEVAFQRFVEFAGLLGIGVGGMRVEFGEHAVDGILHEFFLVDTVDVEIRDGQLCKLQFAELFHINVGLAAFLGEGRCAGAEEREAHEDEMFFHDGSLFFLG